MITQYYLFALFFLSFGVFATTPPCNTSVHLDMSNTSSQVADIMDDLHEQVLDPINFVQRRNINAASRSHEPFTHSNLSFTASNQELVGEDAFRSDTSFTAIPRVQSVIIEEPRESAPPPRMLTFNNILPRNPAFRGVPQNQKVEQRNNYDERLSSENSFHDPNDSSLIQQMTKAKHFLPIHDKELSSIPDIAPVLPSDGVIKFKKIFVEGSDILSLICLVLSRLSYVVSAFGIGDYGFDLNYIDIETRTRIVLICGISAVVFEQIKQVFNLIKLKDELHLISYERKKEDNTRRMINGEEHFFSEDEIRSYLRHNNQFICLPGKRSLICRKFALNSLCILESFLGIATSFVGGISATFITSGMTTSNIISSDPNENRKFTLLFSVVTGVLLGLNYYRLNLKIMCEKWIQNYERLYFFFAYMCHIPKSEMMCEIRYVPPEFVSSQTMEQIQDLDHSVIHVSKD